MEIFPRRRTAWSIVQIEHETDVLHVETQAIVFAHVHTSPSVCIPKKIGKERFNQPISSLRFQNVGLRRHRWIHSSVPIKCFSIHPMLCFASLFVRLCRRCRLFWCFHLIKDVVPVAPLSLFRESVSSSVPNESRSTKTTFEDEDDTRKGSRWSNGMKDIEWMVCRVGFGSSIRSNHVLSTSFDSKK